ncbi:MAG: hypothetical protein WAT74_00150 [Flavobacteriales bacterium]
MCDVLIAQADSTINFGNIACGDSLVLGWWKALANSGSISTAVLLDLGALNNFGTLACGSAQARTFFNSGSFGVVDTLYNTGSILNDGSLQAGHLITVSGVQTSGPIEVGGLFLNGLLGNADSRINQGGRIEVQDFINSVESEIRGPGELCITGHSENHGTLRGSLIICDLSPSMSMAPFLDVNTGTFWNEVTYCTNSTCSWTSLSGDGAGWEVRCFPSPASNTFSLSLGREVQTAHVIEVYGPTGRMITSLAGPFEPRFMISCSGWSSGLHQVRIIDSSHMPIATMPVLIAR